MTTVKQKQNQNMTILQRIPNQTIISFDLFLIHTVINRELAEESHAES